MLDNRYDQRCSFMEQLAVIDGQDDVPEIRVSMKSKTYFPALYDLCYKRKLCRLDPLQLSSPNLSLLQTK
jgi:hypothetical protein